MSVVGAAAVDHLARRLAAAGYTMAEARCLAEAACLPAAERAPGGLPALLDPSAAGVAVNRTLAILEEGGAEDEAFVIRVLMWELFFGRGTWPGPFDTEELYAAGVVQPPPPPPGSGRPTRPPGPSTVPPGPMPSTQAPHDAKGRPSWKPGVAIAVAAMVLVVGGMAIGSQAGGGNSLARTLEAAGWANGGGGLYWQWVTSTAPCSGSPKCSIVRVESVSDAGCPGGARVTLDVVAGGRTVSSATQGDIRSLARGYSRDIEVPVNSSSADNVRMSRVECLP